MEALNRGFEVVKANWQNMLVMAIILIFGIGIISVIIALPLILVVFAAIMPMAISGAQELQTSVIIMLVCMCAYLPILLVANGILTAYTQTAWTLTFMRLTGRKPEKRADALDIPDSPLPDEPSVEPLNG
jgi:Mg2+/Co2+ transporter CorB